MYWGLPELAGDGSAWFQAVQSWTPLTFKGFAPGTQIVNQYAPLGVHFTDGEQNWVDDYTTINYPQDGWGLRGGVLVEIAFDSPTLAFAAHYTGKMAFDFYSGETLLHHSPFVGSGGPNHFTGFTTDVQFDRVRMYGPPEPPPFPPIKVYVDNFYFSTVPAPGSAMVLIALALLRGRRQRSVGQRQKTGPKSLI